jgi:hypothetical protein
MGNMEEFDGNAEISSRSGKKLKKLKKILNTSLYQRQKLGIKNLERLLDWLSC